MRKKPVKRHKVVLRVEFDRPCSATEALKAVRDCIHGEFYPTQPHLDSPDVFTVRGTLPLSSAAKTRR